MPNITGNYYKRTHLTASTLLPGAATTCDGAFACLPLGTNGKVGKSSDANYAQYYTNFNASLSNAIYGASDTVQPLSLKAKFFIKY